MGNPNPFYRFKQGWNAGFFPDNQIVSDLLNEIHGVINANLSTWAQPGITSIYQLKNTIQNLLNTYNAFPYFGNFEIVFTTAQNPPFLDYYIYIRDNSLYAIDQTQQLQITGEYVAANNLIATAYLLSFTPGAYSGAFARPLINEEIKVKEALGIVDINGSAIFPITYSFNPINNVATSGLARGDNWVLSDGVANRQPIPNLPYENRRTFELPQLNGDDAYILSIMEKIIQASLVETDYALGPQTEYNKYTMPDGWTKSASHPAWATYERVQFNFVNAGRRKFILVGRLDGNWLWQRFVSDTSATPYNFLTAYSESTQMPYEVMQAGRWIYNDDTFDLEFVEFTSGCYESPEFYPMPAKPGDQYQFNVVDGNLTGIDSFQIGLFKENGEFVQNIGQATKPIICSCTYGFTYTYSSEEFNNFRLSINGEIISPPQIYYTGFYLFSGTELISYAQGLVPNDFLNTPEDTINYLEGLSNNNFTIVGVINEDDSVTFTVTALLSLECVETSYLASFQTGKIIGSIDPAPIAQFTQQETKCCVDINQFQASVIIPSYRGCYRMGLYNGPSTTCDLTFMATITGASAFIDDLNSLYSGSYLSVGIYDGVSWVGVNGLYVSGSLTIDDIVDYFNSIAGITCTQNIDTNSIEFTYDITVDCDGTYNLKIAITDIEYTIIEGIAQSGTQSCECGSGSVLYSLSNIINIDASECFSTMLEYWGDNNTIAQGYEYQNNWKQRIRIGLNGGGEKPVIEESVYRQSNGVHRRPQNKQDLSIDLHTDFFDLETQLAMTDATRHPYIVWNGQGIFVKGDLDVATIQDFTTETSFEQLAQMKFQVLKQGFQPKNSSCLNC